MRAVIGWTGNRDGVSAPGGLPDGWTGNDDRMGYGAPFRLGLEALERQYRAVRSHPNRVSGTPITYTREDGMVHVTATTGPLSAPGYAAMVRALDAVGSSRPCPECAA